MSAKKSVKVHPLSPNGHLSFLPAAILTLAATLSSGDKEVLAYLISFSGSFSDGHQKPYSTVDAVVDHSPRFDCSCFKCYTRFWSRWDVSPNRELIHKIIEAYEEGVFKRKNSSYKVKKRRKNNKVCDEESDDAAKVGGGEGNGGDGGGETAGGSGDGEVAGSEKGPVRKIVSFIGERIWGVWNKI